jgi:hypothetical protein
MLMLIPNHVSVSSDSTVTCLSDVCVCVCVCAARASLCLSDSVPLALGA